MAKSKYHALSGALLLLLGACTQPAEEDSATPVTTEDSAQTLQAYIDIHSDLEHVPDLIACAAGGHQGFTTEGPAPTSVFFYPVEGASDFRYFETQSLAVDPADHTQYTERTKEIAPVFNGYLRRFVTDYQDHEAWVVVTYLTDGILHRSGHVRLKGGTKPTQFGPELAQVSFEDGHPLFAWEDGRIKENVIYFEVISELGGDLISGTYTTDRHWRFYDTSNVTINIHDIDPPPALTPGQAYHFTLMAVSEDNWVNLIIRKEFTAP